VCDLYPSYSEPTESLGVVARLARAVLEPALSWHFPASRTWRFASCAAAPRNSGSAHLLAEIIQSDAALGGIRAAYCLIRRQAPGVAITSLQHAIAWLGLDDVANIAFTLAFMPKGKRKILHGRGSAPPKPTAWRHSLASGALGAPACAHAWPRDGPVLLVLTAHDIGKAITLGAVHASRRRAGLALAGSEYDALIDIFQRDVGTRVNLGLGFAAAGARRVARWDSML